MPIQSPTSVSEGIQPILRKMLLNQAELITALGGPGASGINLAKVGGTPVSSPLPVDIGGSFTDGLIPVKFGDSPSIDAFDRLRVSDPTGLFESTLTYDKQTLLWNEKLTGTGLSSYAPNQSAAILTVAANGDEVIRQTKDFFRYQPGKSQLIFLTFNFTAPTTNVRKRAGYFTSDNGIFLQQAGDGTISVVLRSYVTGSPVDTVVNQADWNLDTFSDLDPTKAQILIIDLEWLGVGRVRCGLVQNGLIRYFHQFLNANLRDTVYMSTAQLPLRYEITATGVPGATGTFTTICGSVISEGGQDQNIGFPFATRNSAIRTVGGTPLPLISIRPKATFNGKSNRVQVIQRELELFNNGNSSLCAIDVIYNGTLTGAAFASVDAQSVMEVDTSATAVTGGIVVLSLFVGSTNQAKGSQITGITGRLPLSLDIDGLNPTNLTLRGTNLVGTADLVGAFHWQEYR